MTRAELLAARDAKIKELKGQSEASIEYRKESLKEFERRKSRGQKGYMEKAALIAEESIKEKKAGE